MVEWKEADILSVLFVIYNGTEIVRRRLVRRDLEHDSVIFFQGKSRFIQ